MRRGGGRFGMTGRRRSIAVGFMTPVAVCVASVPIAIPIPRVAWSPMRATLIALALIPRVPMPALRIAMSAVLRMTLIGRAAGQRLLRSHHFFRRPMEAPQLLAQRVDLAFVCGLLSLCLLEDLEDLVH